MRYKQAFTILSTILLLVSCKSSKEFTGFSYDPPGVTDTKDKEITSQYQRVIGAGDPKVWIANDFDGARMSDFYALNDSTFEVLIEAENYPINNSPWYAFKIWSDTLKTVKIKLNYIDAKHRYVPKLHSWTASGQYWKEQMELPVEVDSATGAAEFDIALAPEPIIISSQPLYTAAGLLDTLNARGITGKEYVNKRQVGHSKKGRPIIEIEVTEATASQIAPVIVFVGRQHPPEVTGYEASLYFLEELTADNELAREFRNSFVLMAYPLLNPDGVDEGHWRHNAGGIDLNRDWVNFNQPETQVVRDALVPLKNNSQRPLYYAIDFHSTNENIFYPIQEEIKTSPDNITQKWIPLVQDQNPDVVINVEEFDTSSPIAKNWFFRTFGIDAVTYEVDDQISAQKLEQTSRSAARSLMRLLLGTWENEKE